MFDPCLSKMSTLLNVTETLVETSRLTLRVQEDSCKPSVAHRALKRPQNDLADLLTAQFAPHGHPPYSRHVAGHRHRLKRHLSSIRPHPQGTSRCDNDSLAVSHDDVESKRIFGVVLKLSRHLLLSAKHLKTQRQRLRKQVRGRDGFG